MRTLTSLFAAGLLACSMSAIAADDSVRATDDTNMTRNDSDSATNRTADDGRGSDGNAANRGSVVRDGTAKAEYNNECAWGLANGQHVQTTCAVNMTGENGKTYCFSNDKAMAAFMKDPSKNMSKANDTFGRS
jgi:YHS domain-containing protein